jgi:hypothetical protein
MAGLDAASRVGSAAASSADDAARLLVEWFIELGYLEHGDALQIISDEFGDAFLCLGAQGERAIRGDVLDAVRVLMPANGALSRFPHWEGGRVACSGDHPGRKPGKEC